MIICRYVVAVAYPFIFMLHVGKYHDGCREDAELGLGAEEMHLYSKCS